ncbi:BspA family leucine-rich repeat surface protein [archaeon]|nr:MAG: BspA family leucine-rich repeat surface protein [archaeon]
MFDGAEAFDQSVDMWDVSQVYDMWDLFDEIRSFSQPLWPWSLDGGGNASTYSIYLLYHCHALSADI